MKTLVKNNSMRQLMQPSWVNPINRFFRNDFMNIWDRDTQDTVPSLNIKEEKDNYKIELAAPGLKKEDFNIQIENNILTISCESESDTKENNEADNFSRREYNYSCFSRSLSLPANADSEHIAAKYNEGILTLNVPKKSDGQKNNGQKIKVD